MAASSLVGPFGHHYGPAMASTFEVDAAAAIEHCFEAGWTDGLPVVPPTPELVEAMIAAAGLTAGEVLGEISERSRELTVEKAAISAVMAGCRPEYFPVVVTALRAMLDPAFNANAAMTSTGGAALCLIVSGPLVQELGFATKHNALGAGNRANATVGRAVRLVARNVFGARTGEMDGSSIGHPGKYSMVLAEDPPPPPWDPYGVERGFDADQTMVTCLATEGPRQIANHLNPDPEGVLLTYASAMKSPGTYAVGKGAEVIIVIGHEHRKMLLEGGWTKDAIREFLTEHSRVSPEELLAGGVLLETGAQHDMTPAADGRLATVPGPEAIHLVTAGGAGAGWSAYIPVWAPLQHSRSVSRAVD